MRRGRAFVGKPFIIRFAGRGRRQRQAPFQPRSPRPVAPRSSVTRFNWMYEVEPDPSRAGKVDTWWSGLCLGGGSAINGMMFVRGHRDDYDHWSDLGCAGWDYASAGYRISGVWNITGAVRMNGAAARGRPFRGGFERSQPPDPCLDQGGPAGRHPQERRPERGGPRGGGFSPRVAQRRGWRESAAQAYLRPARTRANLQIQLTHTGNPVCCLMAAGPIVSNSSKTGIHNPRKALARSAVIISAGAIASPKLLQLSGIGDAKVLNRMGHRAVLQISPGTGKNLQEHTGIRYSFDVNGETLGSRTGMLHNLGQLFQFLVNGKGLLTTPIAHVPRHSSALERQYRIPNIQVTMAPFHIDIGDNSATLSKEKIAGGAVGLMQTRSRGEITLRSPDPLEPPRIHYPMLDSEEDIEQLIDACRLARRITEQPAFAGYLSRWRHPDDEMFAGDQLRDFVKDAAFPMYHPVGTCRMGHDAQAVVGPDLKVRSVGRVMGHRRFRHADPGHRQYQCPRCS